MTTSAISNSWEPGGTVILTGRGFEQDALAAMSTDIIRGLVEAITNSDDKYLVEGISPARITILVERRHGPWWVSIRDRAGGMSKQELIDKIAHAGGRTSGFEDGLAVRGNRGRGAKDLAAFGPVLFESIKDGYYAALKIEPHGQWSVSRKPLPATAEIREPLGLPRNSSGTVVTIQVREAIRCPRLQKIREKTQSHYQLRDVMRDPNREVLLVNATRSDEKYKLHYGVDTTKLEGVLSAELDLPDYPEAEARLVLWRLADNVPERPASDPYRPQGVLIVGQRAIYDNTLFSFEGNTYAHRFTGRLECPHIDRLIREFDDRRDAAKEPTAGNPQPIISRTRDGLVRDHPFFQQLREAADEKLGEVLEAEEEKERTESGSVENQATKRALSQAARTAARYLRQSLQDLDDEEPLPPGDDVQFAIRPPRVVVEEGTEKTLSIVAPRDLFDEGREVELLFDPEGIVDLVGTVSPLGPHRARDDLLSTTVRVRGVLASQATILTASAGSSSEVAWIDVIPAAEEPEAEPPEQFEFEKDRYRIRWQKRKRLTVQAPLDSGLDGVELRASSDSDGVAVIGQPHALHPDPDLGYLIGHINVEARKLQARATIEVHAKDSVADCRVQVSTQEDGDIDLEIRLQPQLLGSFRSTIKEESINGHPKLYLDVMAKHPTLSRYIGDPPDYRGQNSLPWRALLAEVIAEAIVRKVLERKYPVESQGMDAEAFFVELFQRTTELAPRIHRELLPAQELNGSADK